MPSKSRRIVVALTLPLVAAAGHTARPVADAIFYNGTIVTVDHRFRVTQAFAVKDGRFLDVGSTRRMLALARPETHRTDLKGGTVIPGLTDSHDHLWNTAKYLNRGVDLLGVTTFDELRRRLETAIAAAPPNGIVFTTIGWNVALMPDRATLDRMSPTVPVVLIGTRRGSALFNGAALARLGIDAGHASFNGIAVPVDGRGIPDGHPPPYPASVQMIDALIPPLSPQQAEATLAIEMQRRNAVGITAVRDLSVWPDGVEALRRMRADGKLTLRVAIGMEWPGNVDVERELATLAPPDRSDPWLFPDALGRNRGRRAWSACRNIPD